MKRIAFLLPLLFIFAGCTVFRSAPATPAVVGSWDYVVHDTPQGDAPGTLSVDYADGIFSGMLAVEVLMQRVPIEEATWAKDVFSFNAALDINGAVVTTKTTLAVAGDTAEGTIDVPGYGTYKITGTRQATASH